jgi:Fe2+ or Zn2+ uptake regulation protein
METSASLYEWMLRYQRENGRSPLMREMAEQFDALGYRSSVRHTLQNLTVSGMVIETKPAGASRRYEAVDQQDSESSGTGCGGGDSASPAV